MLEKTEEARAITLKRHEQVLGVAESQFSEAIKDSYKLREEIDQIKKAIQMNKLEGTINMQRNIEMIRYESNVAIKENVECETVRLQEQITLLQQELAEINDKNTQLNAGVQTLF